MIPIGHFLVLAAILFAIGLFAVLVRKNAIIVLMGVELMLNAANLTLLAFARAQHDMRGHAIAFLVIATAASEAAVGLAIVVGIFRTRHTANLDEVTLMKH